MTPGIYQMSAADYHAGPCPSPELSNSIIKVLLGKSPLHAWCAHPKLNPGYKPYEADKFDLGTAAHSLLLEGDDNIVIVDAEDWRTKAAKEARESARQAGRTALLTRHYMAAKEMAVLAREYIAKTQLAGIFEAGKPEQTVVWTSGDLPGIWCKARMDYLAPGVILDYKTTSAANPRDFMRSSMTAFGYDVQDCFYRQGLASATGERAEFLFLVQEDTAPFACYLVQAGESMREMASHKVNRAVTYWQTCLRSDNWPAYGTIPLHAAAPGWAVTEEFSHEGP
jgi:hypothetical protein